MMTRHLTSCHNAVLALSLLLALSCASFTQGIPTDKVFRKRGGIWNPLTDDGDSGARISEANGLSLVSSLDSNGVAMELWDITGTRFDSKIAPDSTEDSKGGRKSNSTGNGGGGGSSDPLQKADPDSGGPDAAAIDIQGWHCATACSFQDKYPKPNPDDCRAAYTELYGRTGIYTISPTQAFSATKNTCSIWLINHSGQNITYDYWDTAGTAQWLNGHCITEKKATLGLCLYNGIGTNVTNGVWTGVCHPSFMNG
ncbi:hypothetical protein FRB91_007005 [Serendipita sp. 411]|nr:hypothetical protein FRB91_007005 [Serendipita sp. 411]